MPEPNDIQKKAREWFLAKVPEGFKCSCCGRSDWAVGPSLVAVPAFTEWNRRHFLQADLFVPMLPLFCEYCGYVRFFSAVSMGLVQADEPPPSPPAHG